MDEFFIICGMVLCGIIATSLLVEIVRIICNFYNVCEYVSNHDKRDSKLLHDGGSVITDVYERISAVSGRVLQLEIKMANKQDKKLKEKE
jgi:hypothetical protein